MNLAVNNIKRYFAGAGSLSRIHSHIESFLKQTLCSLPGTEGFCTRELKGKYTLLSRFSCRYVGDEVYVHCCHRDGGCHDA